ncbi:type 1 fimbrial major subunit FimA, partial [Escherichia coli]
MKLRFISSALAAALFAATGSYAAVVDGGTIHFEGELVNAACSVNTDSADQVVTLGQYRTDIFNAVGNTSALIPFTIQLNDCDPVVAANAAVAFSGQADAINDNLLAIASSTKEGANKQVISSQVDSLIKISRIWADFFPANTSNQPI